MTPFPQPPVPASPAAHPQAQAAQRLLEQLLHGFHTADIPLVLSCFAADATIEYPYAAQLGSPTRLDVAAYAQHLHRVLPHMPGLVFSHVRLAHDLAQGVHWAEAHGEAPVPNTDHTYRQDYVIRFELANGVFRHYREYWNQLATREAFGGARGPSQFLAPTPNP